MLALIVQFRKILSLILVVFISLWLLKSTENQKSNFAHGMQVSILAPAQYAINKINRISNIFKTNRLLLESNTKLKAENDILQIVKKANIELRDMLAYRNQSSFKLIPAEVIAQKQDLLSNNIIITSGSKKGIKKDMPVLCLKGVVGKVLECYLFNSNVQMINAPTARTGVLLERINVPGILEFQNAKIPIIKIPQHHNIEIGDKIITSGLGGIYPKGLTVGFVEKIIAKDNLFKTIRVRLHSGLNNIENIFVMNIKTTWSSFENKEGVK